MKLKASLKELRPTIVYMSFGLVLILILLTVINPSRKEINQEFVELGISPADDLIEAIKLNEIKINKALNNKKNFRYSFFESIDLKQMRMMIDSIKLSLTTGFQFSITELDETTMTGLIVKNFNLKGRSSYLALSGFISSIENYPKLMRFSSGEIKYYGVLEQSVAFVEYELNLSVFVPTGKFYIPPFKLSEDSLFNQVDIFLPFLENISYYSDPSAIDLADYELKSIKDDKAYFQHIRFNEQKILKAGDEVKSGIITQISGNIVKIMMIKGSGADFVELKQPE